MSSELAWMRVALEERLAQLVPLADCQRPHKGWVTAIREVVGMTTVQLGQRIGISGAAISKLEQRERDKTIQLQTLEKAAAALGCDLTYVLVPKTSLEDFMKTQAKKKAREHYQAVSHSMLLEEQGLDEVASNQQLEEMVADLIISPKDLWS